MSRNFIVYSTPSCTYCTTAKAHLTRLGETIEERDAREEGNNAFLKSQGFTKVPQIYVCRDDRGPEYIGGYDKLRVWLEANP